MPPKDSLSEVGTLGLMAIGYFMFLSSFRLGILSVNIGSLTLSALLLVDSPTAGVLNVVPTAKASGFSYVLKMLAGFVFIYSAWISSIFF